MRIPTFWAVCLDTEVLFDDPILDVGVMCENTPNKRSYQGVHESRYQRTLDREVPSHCAVRKVVISVVGSFALP